MTNIGNLGGSVDSGREAMRRITEAAQHNSVELDLSKLSLDSTRLDGDWRGWQELSQLTHVESLNLGENQLTAIPAEGWAALSQLQNLKSLDLRKNGMVAIPDEGWSAIGQLTKLHTLELSGNGMRTIPNSGWQALGHLSNLARLCLDYNAFDQISPEGWHAIRGMTKLTSLFLHRNEFVISAEGWEALGGLTGLKNLFLSRNQLNEDSSQTWDQLSRLAKLEFLLLSGDDNGPLPDDGWNAIGQLVNLQHLHLSYSALATIPSVGWAAIGRLTRLESLGLRSNRIRSIPSEGWRALSQLGRLRSLFFEGNAIGNISADGWEALSSLPNLELLDLSKNQISEIPLRGWGRSTRFPKLANLDISGNPLPDDLLVAAARGAQSFLGYLDGARLSTAHPRTVKLLLLGEPACGKTTLVEALSGNREPCDQFRPETIGVNVRVRRLEKISPLDGQPLYLATWDFAGQHMEYATHQFFLKSGGIYLILWKARLGSDYGQRDLWYWLELLKMRVQEPEFLVVTTHTGKTPSAFDVREVQAVYPGCKGHFEVELCDGTGLAALEAKILELAAGSPSMKAAWPSPWLAVRDAVRNMRANTSYISTAEFWKLCSRNGVTGTQEQQDLADQLDKLGEIVYYSNEPLASFVILDPTWVTELVARVVRDKQVRDQSGVLNRVDLGRIWGDLPATVSDHLESLMDDYDLVL